MSSPIQGNSGPNKRYDRQVRIWGAHGQARLERTRVCVLGAGPTATETLKNLVLGGIGSFTIVDPLTVTSSDLCNNFFFSSESLGKGRAEAATKLLCELNDSVICTYSDHKLEDLLDRQREFFQDFDLVIATQVRESLAVKLDDVCRSLGIKLVLVRSYGPFGTLRVSGPELCIIESRPENVPHDLRLVSPWPELLEYADSIDFSTCDDITHEHVPYAVCLLKCMRMWLDSHEGPPANAQQRREFKESIQRMQRVVDGVPLEEQNWQEAMRAANTAWVAPSIPAEVQALLDDPATSLQPSSSLFWVVVAALKRFVAAEGRGALPLEGSIPDMWSTTELFLKLQRIYRAKAEEHCAAVTAYARELQKAAGIGADDAALAKQAKTMCLHAHHLRVARFKPLKHEYFKPHNVECLKENLSQESADEAAIYLLLRAADQFYETHGRIPGATPQVDDTTWEDDIQQLRAIASKLMSDLGLQSSTLPQEMIVDVCRSAGGELHCTAALVGGIAAQECIKIVMEQFVPITGTLVYNGSRSSTVMFEI